MRIVFIFHIFSLYHGRGKPRPYNLRDGQARPLLIPDLFCFRLRH